MQISKMRISIHHRHGSERTVIAATALVMALLAIILSSRCTATAAVAVL